MAWTPKQLPEFDDVVARLAQVHTSVTEADALSASHWAMGEDARLREDARFRSTPWGRWMLAAHLLANDTLFSSFARESWSEVDLAAALADLTVYAGRRCVFCPADPRFVLEQGRLRLSARSLSDRPLIEGAVGPDAQYATHLPLHSLRAAAASEPAGEWGDRAQDEVIETLGWVRLQLPGGRGLNDRMFVARVVGHSMDNGRNGLTDGALAVFELWPAGELSEQDVLVRGAFTDPETGSYAVKRLAAREPIGDDGYERLTLVSLNPDKARYPDITVEAADEDAVTVVAKLIHALAPGEYARAPKQERRPGRRLVDAGAGLFDVEDRLSRKIAAFFDGAAQDDDEEALTPSYTGWSTRVTCQAANTGGVQLELGPLTGLLGVVKKLQVLGPTWSGSLLAANAKQRAERLSVPPGSGPWHVEAVGFEDESDFGFDRLNAEALPTDAATVFRVDATGVGRRHGGQALSQGQAYRIVIPPERLATTEDEPFGDELAGGWRLWALDLSGQTASSVLAALRGLGLSVGAGAPGLEWASGAPVAWRSTARGQDYPVFEVGDSPVLHVKGLPEGEERAVVFLRTPDETRRLELPAGDSAFVALGPLTPGRWACNVLHPRTRVPPVTVVFEVAADATSHVDAGWAVRLGSGRESATKMDLLELARTRGEIAVTAPPCWPVRVSWRMLGVVSIATAHADAAGDVDMAAAQAFAIQRARRARVADLLLDLGELGRHVIQHARKTVASEVHESIRGLVAQRESIVRSRAGAWMPLMAPWFEPILELLGYQLLPMTSTMPGGPEDAAVWQLVIDERRKTGIKPVVVRVLILSADLEACYRAHSSWIDECCDELAIRIAILSDGLRWDEFRRGAEGAHASWHLPDVVAAGELATLVRTLGEGIP